jgi:hypothetical protein
LKLHHSFVNALYIFLTNTMDNWCYIIYHIY